MHWYLEVLRKYADFSGRARRKEYWLYGLFHVIISVVLTGLDYGLGFASLEGGGIGILSSIYGLAVLVPGLAVAVRRLHDTSRSGWWMLLIFIPIIGGLVLLWFVLQDSHPANQYGPNPKQV